MRGARGTHSAPRIAIAHSALRLHPGYRLRSTGAGFWPSAVKVPIRPSITVTATAATAP